jgi:putative transposase
MPLWDGPLERGRVWQPRFYDFVVFSARKRVEKLRYMHRNPVKRGLVLTPEQWAWSSYRHYAFEEPGPVLVNEPRKAELTARKIS